MEGRAVTSTEPAAGERVLPSSRQPMPSSEAYVRPAEEPARRNGDVGDRRRRSAAEIEAELDVTTDRLAANVDALVERLSPKQVIGRSVDSVKGLVTAPTGRPRAEVIGATVGALVGVAVVVWLARRHRS
jgi:hypothetical protein